MRKTPPAASPGDARRAARRPAARGPTTIDAYIAGFPADVQAILQRVRRTIQRAAPAATEAIKYGLPTFVLRGNLVHFGAFKEHIGLYPTPAGVAAFRRELAAYQGAKGSVRFPLQRPIPYALIARITAYRVRESGGDR